MSKYILLIPTKWFDFRSIEHIELDPITTYHYQANIRGNCLIHTLDRLHSASARNLMARVYSFHRALAISLIGPRRAFID